ncbi:MAG: hypothetical protein ACOYJQ_07050 [Pseudochelatococcus sp.]|jgi:localization factor PodJL|uniref:hypothetical protein n=1 Tax=Pseudochelatococcus sp. TaxID=2020869 RepID=UPI003D8A057A
MTSQSTRPARQATEPAAPSASWSVKGISPSMREAVKEAARRADMTVGEWLSLAIAHQAESPAKHRDPQDERWAEIAAHLARLVRRDVSSPREQAAPPRDAASRAGALPLPAVERLVREIAARNEQRNREQAARVAEALTGLARYIAGAEDRRREEARQIALRQEQEAESLTRTLALVARRVRHVEQRMARLPEAIAAPMQDTARQQAEAIAAAEERLTRQMQDILAQLRESRDPPQDGGQIGVEDRLARAIVDIRTRQVELARIEAGEEDGVSQHVIIERLETLSRKLDDALRPTTEALRHPALDDVLTRLDRIDSRLVGENAPAELARIEDMVRTLAENVEALHRAGDGTEPPRSPGAAGPIDSLAEQISHLAQRLDAAARQTSGSASNPVDVERLQALEASIGALSAQLRGLPQADDASLERMARVAAREALAALSSRDDADDGRARELRERELRTGDTLDAVHSTLERIVDRLALLEEDLRTRGLRDIVAEEPEKRAAQALLRAGAPAGGAEVEGPENLLARSEAGLTENVGFTASFIAAARRAAMAGADETRGKPSRSTPSPEAPAGDEDGAAARRRSLMIGLGALIAATGAAQISAALMHGAARLS